MKITFETPKEIVVVKELKRTFEEITIEEKSKITTSILLPSKITTTIVEKSKITSEILLLSKIR
jgi:hypothetical protein